MKKLVEKVLDGEKIAIHVKDSESANIFVEVCKDWEIDCGGFDMTGEDYFVTFGNKTCFTIENNQLQYCNCDWYEKEGYKIVPFETLAL